MFHTAVLRAAPGGDWRNNFGGYIIGCLYSRRITYCEQYGPLFFIQWYTLWEVGSSTPNVFMNTIHIHDYPGLRLFILMTTLRSAYSYS